MAGMLQMAFSKEFSWVNPNTKVHGANMGPSWGRQDPGGPHVGHMNFAIWETFSILIKISLKFIPKKCNRQ